MESASIAREAQARSTARAPERGKIYGLNVLEIRIPYYKVWLCLRDSNFCCAWMYLKHNHVNYQHFGH